MTYLKKTLLGVLFCFLFLFIVFGIYLELSMHEIAGGGVFFGGKLVLVGVLVGDVVADFANVKAPLTAGEACAESWECLTPTDERRKFGDIIEKR